MLRRAFIATAALPLVARAQGFPDRPVTLVVPFAPGGSADVLARALAPAMAEVLGQPVVVELRPGAGGNIGAAHVAQGPRADGHTLLLASLSLSTAPALQSIPWDPLRDLAPVAGLGAIPNLLIVSPNSPYRDLAGLLAAARARPGAISYGSSGPGTGSHLAGALLAAQAGVDMLHVPYRGSGAVYPDLIAERIGFLLDVAGSSAPQVVAGTVRALGITATQRAAAFPDLPTIAEQGLAGFSFLTWFGVFARAGTPEPALHRLEAAVLAGLATPAVRDRLAQAGALPIPAPAAGFGAWFAAEVARWQAMVREGKIARLD